MNKCTFNVTEKKDCQCGAVNTKIKKCTCGAKWSFTVDVGINPKTGRRKQKTVSGFNTKEEAEREAKKIEYKVMNNTYLEESDILFKDFAEDWLSHYAVTNNVKKPTLRIRRNQIANLNKFFEFIPIRDIKKKDYQKLLRKLIE